MPGTAVKSRDVGGCGSISVVQMFYIGSYVLLFTGITKAR